MVNKLRAKRFVGVIAASAMAAPAAGAEQLAGESLFFDDLPVFLSVARLPQTVSEMPASVTVIDRDLIEASGALEVTDLLRLVPGFQVGHYHDTDGSRTIVASHGFSDQYARRMQVLIDGRSVYTPATGGPEWPDLPLALEDIERIEVIRGPNGAAYGSNAFLGTINIITRHSRESDPMAGVTFGDRGYRQGLARLAGGGTDLSYRVTGSYRRSGGSYQDVKDDRREDNDSITRTLTVRADYRPAINDYWTFQAGLANGTHQVGNVVDPMNPVREQQVVAEYQQVKWKRVLNSESEVEVQFYHNLNDRTDRFRSGLISTILGVPPGALPFPDQTFGIDQSLDSERWNVEASHWFRLSPQWRLVWGAEYRVDEVSGADYFDGDGPFTNRGMRYFANAEWEPSPRWTVNLGDLYEQNDLVDGVHSPRLSVTRRLGEHHYLRLTGSRGYRMPVYLEEEADFTLRLDDGTLLARLYTTDGNLDPERIDSVELVLGYVGEALDYEVKAFRHRITSVFANLTVPFEPTRFVNEGEITIRGTELQLRAQPQEGLIFSAAFATAWASGWRQDTADERDDLGDTVPDTTMSFLVSKRMTGGDMIGMSVYAVGPLRYLDGGDHTEGVDAIDLHYSHRFSMGDRDGNVRLLLRDVTGSYFDFQKRTRRESQAFATVELGL